MALAFCLSSPAESQQATKEYRADLARLFSEIFSAEVLKRQSYIFFPTLRAAVKAGDPSLSDRALDIFASELESAIEPLFKDPARFGDLIADSFAKEFTHDEVKQILSFYLSRAG
jgi:hypothetical protein